MTPFTTMLFIIGGLAAYRLTVLFVRDAGPWDVFKRLRRVVRFSKWMTCVFCFSITAAVAVSAGLYGHGVRMSWYAWALLVLAYSSTAIILDRTFTSDYQA